MIIIYQQRLSLSSSTGLAFASAPQSAPGTNVRPLPNTFAAVRSLELTYRQQHPRPHIQLNFLAHLKSLGRSTIPLYNPHRTR